MLAAVTLHRSYKSNCTIGRLTLPDGLVLYTMERPWLNNKRNVSCIPEGLYYCKWLRRSASGKYKRVWHVLNVPGRSGVLFHSGNLARHSRGCILPGLKQGMLGGAPAVLSSKAALGKMRRALACRDFVLYVTGD